MKKNTRLILLALVFVLAIGLLKVLYDKMIPAQSLGLGQNKNSTIADTRRIEGKTSTIEDQGSDQVRGNTTSLGTNAGATTATQNSTETKGGKDTISLPDIKVTDANGKEVSLSSFRGQKVVLNIWASWCGPCQAEMPDFLALDQKKDKNFTIIMLNLTSGMETMDNAKKFLAKEKLNFQNLLFDTKGEAAAKLEVVSIPTTLFIDELGEVHYYHAGTLGQEDILEGVSKMEKQ